LYLAVPALVLFRGSQGTQRSIEEWMEKAVDGLLDRSHGFRSASSAVESEALVER
jgi:hypothetical protein